MSTGDRYALINGMQLIRDEVQLAYNRCAHSHT
jgi:hypothetical protein